MSETILSSSSNSIEKDIDDYHDDTSYSGSSGSSHSTEGSSTDEGYTSGAPGFPIEVIQEQLRKASGSQVGSSSSVPPSDSIDEVEIVYSCAIGGNPVDIGRDPFAPYTGDLGNLRPQVVKRPSLSKFFRNCVHRAHLHVDRSFHSLVTLRRLAKWGLGPQPSDEAIAHEVTVRRRMSTMKENKGKNVVAEGSHLEVQPQTRPSTGDKRKTLPKNFDLGSLPSRQGKKAKHGERFKELSLADEGTYITKCITSFKGKLALLKFGSGVQPQSMLCSIWVMTEYGVLDSWDKLCVLPIENLADFIGFTKYGLILIQKRSRLVSTNIELERKHKFVLIDPEALHEKEISNKVDYCLDVAAYMENLALLDGANVVSY
uniref:Uncharacterized protein n=1 Tax=Quercus lobata TaxID=97700 RepID=A0A7N2MJG0_QUELO